MYLHFLKSVRPRVWGQKALLWSGLFRHRLLAGSSGSVSWRPGGQDTCFQSQEEDQCSSACHTSQSSKYGLWKKRECQAHSESNAKLERWLTQRWDHTRPRSWWTHRGGGRRGWRSPSWGNQSCPWWPPRTDWAWGSYIGRQTWRRRSRWCCCRTSCRARGARPWSDSSWSPPGHRSGQPHTPT